MTPFRCEPGKVSVSQNVAKMVKTIFVTKCIDVECGCIEGQHLFLSYQTQVKLSYRLLCVYIRFIKHQPFETIMLSSKNGCIVIL